MTRTAKLLAAGCFVLATVAACGSQAVSTGSGGPGGASLTEAPSASPPVVTTPPPVNTTTQPVPSQPRSPVPPGQVDAQGTTPPNGVSVTKDGMFVVFNAAQSGCEHVTAALLSQTSAVVTIQVRTTVVNHGGQVCPMIVRLVPLTVHLSEPLGGRHVAFQHVRATTSGN
jgi:hypothetical protein